MSHRSRTTSLCLLLIALLLSACGVTPTASARNGLAFYALEPGQTLPYEITGFSAIYDNPALAERVLRSEVAIDPRWTYQSGDAVVALETSNDTSTQDGAYWTFKGAIVNTADQPLARAYVIVAVYDAANNLVSMDYESLFPADGQEEIASGASIMYENNQDQRDGYDLNTLMIKTFVQGYVK